MLRYFFLFAALQFSNSSAFSQTISQAEIRNPRAGARVEESFEEGRLSGEAAANRADIGTRSAGGFVGGLSVGFFGILAAANHEAGSVIGTAAGVGGIAASASGNAAPSAELMSSVSSRGVSYEQGFREGYTRRLKIRRASAALGGGFLGTLAGAGLFFLRLIYFTPFT